MSPQEVMLRCATTNAQYMRGTIASQQGYGALVRLYERIARESVFCAQAWVDDKPCPPHEPATSAFWWGVATWATCFPTDLIAMMEPPGEKLLHHEVFEVFTKPHVEFATWLRPLKAHEQSEAFRWYEDTKLFQHASVLILHHDAVWIHLVIRLTARWGLGHHLKDLPALGQALFLMRRLRRGPRDPIARAYLESDLIFLQELFGHFKFSPELRDVLDRFLVVAREEVPHAD